MSPSRLAENVRHFPWRPNMASRKLQESMANQFIFPDFKQIFDIIVIQVLGKAKGSALLI